MMKSWCRLRFLFAFTVGFGFVLILSAGVQPALAKGTGYPSREIRMIVPFGAGGGTDVICRFTAKLMEEKLGVPIVVVNKPGGGGSVGFIELASSKPDGYTIGAITTSLILQQYSGIANVDYRNYAPIIVLASGPAALCVPSNSQFKNIHDLIAYAKTNPGKLRCGNSGTGAIWHLCAVGFEANAGISLVHVPYPSGAEASAAAAGGHIEVASVSATEVVDLVAAGKLRVLAVSSSKRHPLYPDAPTFEECGVNFSGGVWWALAAPKDTPRDVVNTLASAARECLSSQEYKDFLKNNGYGEDLVGTTGTEFADLLASDDAKYRKLLEELGLKVK